MANQPVDPSKLGELYPAAKTNDDRWRDNAEEQARHRGRMTKYPALKIAAYNSVVFAGLLLLVSHFPNAFVFYGTLEGLSSVSTVFGGGLALSFLAWQCAKFASKATYSYGRAIGPFAVAYASIAVLLLVAYSLHWLATITPGYEMLALVAAHFILVALLFKIFLRYKPI